MVSPSVQKNHVSPREWYHKDMGIPPPTVMPWSVCLLQFPTGELSHTDKMICSVDQFVMNMFKYRTLCSNKELKPSQSGQVVYSAMLAACSMDGYGFEP